MAESGIELAKAYVQIIPSAQGIGGQIKKELGGEVEPAAEETGVSAGQKLFGAIRKIAAAAGIGKVIKDSIVAGADLEQSIGGIETLFKESADQVIANAKRAYQTAGMSANDYMELTTGFSASLLSSLGNDTAKAADVADMAMTDMSDNSNKLGTNMEDIKNAYQGFAKQNYTMLDNLKLGYGGTQDEMKRLLEDARKITGVTYDIDNLADVYQAIHVIQGELDITGTTAKEAASTISGSLNAMKAAYQNVMGNLALGEDIGPSLNALKETAVTFVRDNLLPAAVNVVSALPTALVSLAAQLAAPMLHAGVQAVLSLAAGLTSAIPELLREATKALEGIVNAIITGVPALINAGMLLLNGLAQGLLEAVPELLAALPGIVDNLTTTLAAFLPQFISAVNLLVMGVVQALPTAIQQIVAVLPALIDSLINVLLTLMPEIVDAGLALLSALVADLPEIISAVAAAIPEIVDAIVNAIITGVPALINAGMLLLNGLAQGLLEAVPELLAALPGIVDNLTTTLAAFLPQFISAVNLLVMGVVQALPTAIQQIVAVLPALIDSLINVLLTLMPEIVDAGLALLSALVADLPEIISAVAAAIPEIVDAIVNAIISSIPLLIDAGIQLLTMLVGNLPAIINGIVSALPTIINSIVNAVLGSIPLLIRSGIQLFVALVSNLPAIISGVVAAVPQIIDAIVGGFAGGFDAMANIGLNLIKGIWSGISDAAAWLKSKIAGFFGGVVDSIRDFFGIHSPSRLMAGIGKNMALGIGVGWEDTFPDIAEDITDSVKLDFDAGPVSCGRDHNQSGSVSVVQNIYSKAQTAADLMREAKWEQERAVMMGV